MLCPFQSNEETKTIRKEADITVESCELFQTKETKKKKMKAFKMAALTNESRYMMLCLLTR